MWICKFIVFCSFYYNVAGDTISYLFAIRPITCVAPGESDDIPVLQAGHQTELSVYGTNLTPNAEIGFTSESDCDYPIKTSFSQPSPSSYKGVVTFTPPRKFAVLSKTKYYACLKNQDLNLTLWQHQGNGDHVTVYVEVPLFTTWMSLAVIVICYMMSSLMTGLNLGLMSLDNSELQLLLKSGTAKEKKYASRIIPIRKNGNFLVCSIVITSTLCNAISTVITETFVNDIITVVITTLSIVMLCEILPQSICSAYPLQIGGNTAWITRICMFFTFPISYPLSRFLNFIVGKELAKSYNKEILKGLLKNANLPSNQEKIITGTLDFGNKNVEDVMTPLDDVYKLPITTILNFETVAAISASGYSRIPIYDGDISNISYVLYTRDLALLNPEDAIPVKDLIKKPNCKCHYIPKGTSLFKVLQYLKESRYHMIFITDDANKKDKERGNVIGLITFEDLIEEIFQIEIVDETDTIHDNKGKKKMSLTLKTDIISSLLSQPKKANFLSENIKLAAYCFLSEIDEFSQSNISPKVILSLLNLDIYYTTGGKNPTKENIYTYGVPADYFVMILEGEMEVLIGKEKLVLEVRPFRYFGVQALRSSSFIPDYTLSGTKESLHLKIPCQLYTALLHATRFERFKEALPHNANSEVKKYFNQIIEFIK